jgi:ABC-type phosphate/phosphonate transport system ATPase subunit
MDGKPVQIIAIDKKNGTQKSQYKFQLDSLFEILSPINDKEIAIISIAGQSRKGKSFLLSYLLRYLSDYTNVNWIGDENEPLKGIHLFKISLYLHIRKKIFQINSKIN